MLSILLPSALAACPVMPWPWDDWHQADGDPDAAAVAALEAYAFQPELGDEERAGVRTQSVVVVQGGHILYERYDRGVGPDNRQLTWSVSKTYTAAMAGVAVEQGALDVQDSVCKHLPDTPSERCDITVKDVLEWGTGLHWKETYENEPPTTSSVIAMLYGEGRMDMAQFTLSHPSVTAPGQSYMYSTGDSNVLAAVAQAALEPVGGERWAHELLFDRIGAPGTVFEEDGNGVPSGGSYVWATPRDMARFGQLMLADGCTGEERLLPEGWVEWMVEGNDSHAQQDRDGDNDVPGRHVWPNRQRADGTRPWPTSPADMYKASGHWGQSITVIPSRDLVLIRTADDRDGSFDHDRFVGLVLEMVE